MDVPGREVSPITVSLRLIFHKDANDVLFCIFARKLAIDSTVRIPATPHQCSKVLNGLSSSERDEEYEQTSS